MLSINKITESPEETISLANSLSGSFLDGGIYGFVGDLASGKTTFIKGLLSGLDFRGVANSPTFTLINEYNAKRRVVHMDCYRESDINRWIQLGILEYFNSNDLILIEWPDIIKSILPDRIKYIKFSNIDKNKRRIETI
tara:strand:+ start:5929 stop:6345 length:417 start_codon:yes stop_codon:yes gene_type:complete